MAEAKTTQHPKTEPPAPAEEGGRSRFINPFNDHALLLYFREVRKWHGYIQFLGMPHLKDEADMPIGRLFVEPQLSRERIDPNRPPDQWPERLDLLETLEKHPRLVLLGDPGSGKSTLVSWLAWQFTRTEDTIWTERLGRLVPFPFIVRDLKIGADITWGGLLDAFLDRPMAKPLESREKIEEILHRGQGFLMFDGLDEIRGKEVREGLRDAIFQGAKKSLDSRFVLTSRIVGYDEVPLSGRSYPPTYRGVKMPSAITSSCRLAEAERGALSRLDADAVRRTAGAFPAESKLVENTGLSEEDWADICDTVGEMLEFGAEEVYASPFSDEQIAAFAHNWYAQREKAEAQARDRARDFVQAIHRHEGTLRLARVPNLLTFMALIHRIRARLPHGRAKLYDQIAEAYLESIDAFRGLAGLGYPLEEKKHWLARVGFEMQLRRSESGAEKDKTAEKGETEAQSTGREILAKQDDVVEWITDAMRREGLAEDARAAAEKFVDYVARRSGLLLPRGEGLFAFIHLSFQEYFAALYVADLIVSPQWARRDADVPDGAKEDDLRAYTAQSRWAETILVLFEILAERRGGWADELLGRLFTDWFANTPTELEDADDRRNNVLAELSVDPYSGLSMESRRTAWKACWSVHVGKRGVFRNPLAQRPLVGAAEEYRLGVWQALKSVASGRGITCLDLSSCEILRDLSPLAGLTRLEGLDLRGCTNVRDLSPLAGLTGLKSLYLNGCTNVRDLSPLAGLAHVEWLHLSGCTNVRDLSPLAGLTGLKWLYLTGCLQVADFTPLAELAELEWLNLTGCANVADLSPLANLPKLTILLIGDCTRVTDLSPLAGLAELEVLRSTGCANVADLSPLGNLPKLTHLDIGDCTRVTDLSPLAGLAELEVVNLSGCANVADLSPLAGLAKLEVLDLTGCANVADLSPLGNLQKLRFLDLRGSGGLDSLPEAVLGKEDLVIRDLTEAQERRRQDLLERKKRGGPPRRAKGDADS